MLDYVSEKAGKPKAEIFRTALTEFYNNVRLNEFNLTVGDEDTWDIDAISLKRVVKCPHCGIQNRIDLEDECDISTDERQMGPETLYEFNYEDSCSSCGNLLRISGYISEYPVGALNHEEIKVTTTDE